jgi:hypothetical protein
MEEGVFASEVICEIGDASELEMEKVAEGNKLLDWADCCADAPKLEVVMEVSVSDAMLGTLETVLTAVDSVFVTKLELWMMEDSVLIADNVEASDERGTLLTMTLGSCEA